MNKLSFAAINKYLEDYKVDPDEREIRGQGFISWGANNKYPTYLYDLYTNVATLKSVIDTCVDYICGDSCESSNAILTDEELEDLLAEVAKSYCIYGGFAINVLRNKFGGIAKLVPMDFRRIRSSKDGKWLFYSEDFDTKSYGRAKYLKIPAFDKDKKTDSSVYYYKNSKYTTYPTPIYNAAITGCELEKSIDEYHLNSINNGFTGSVLVSLNNGVPDDELKEEIERNFNEKFSGKENAGRIVISYGEDKEHAASIEQILTEDFSERYQSLANRSRQAIFTAFRCNPNLVGIATESNGFNSEEYQSSYALFYRTVIRPIQKKIIRALNSILDGEYVTINPFKIDFDNAKNTEEVE